MEKEALEDGGTKTGGVRSWNCSAVAHQVILQAVYLQCRIRIAQSLVTNHSKRIVTVRVFLKCSENKIC
jgi:hypothetical protein